MKFVRLLVPFYVADVDLRTAPHGFPKTFFLPNLFYVSLLCSTSRCKATRIPQWGIRGASPLQNLQVKPQYCVLGLLGKRSVSERSDSEGSGSERSAGERGGSKISGSETSGSETSGSDRSGSDRSGSETSGSDRSGSERSGSDRIVSEEIGSEVVARRATSNFVSYINVT